MLDSLLDAVEKGETLPFSNEMKEKVETEIVAFAEWWATPVDQGGCGNGPLVPFEAAYIRTYLVARMTGRFPSTLELPRTSQDGEPASPEGTPTSPSP